MILLTKNYYLCSPFIRECKVSTICGNSSVGRASASQAEGREFESRFPLKQTAVAAGCFQWLEMKGRQGHQPDSGLLESASLAKGKRKGSAAS